MQFTKFIAFLSLAVAGLAAPTVEIEARTGSGFSCDQSTGTAACCQQVNKQQATSGLASSIGPAVGGILGIFPAILPLIVPLVSVAVQCVSLVQVPLCGNTNVCCLSPSSNTNSPSSAGLINLLNNNNIVVCPGITF